MPVTVADYLVIARARRRDPKAAEKIEHAIKNREVTRVLSERQRRREMLRDDVDHCWPASFLKRPVRFAKRTR